MRKTAMIFCMLMLVAVMAGACAKPRFQRIEFRPALTEFEAADNGYIQKVVEVPDSGSRWAVSPSLQERYVKAVAASLGRQASRFQLLMAGDKGVPDFSGLWTDAQQPGNVSQAVELARRNGINALLRISLSGFRTEAEMSGMMFWRDMQYHMIINGALDILDPVTGAKTTSLMTEETIKIDQTVYQAIEAGQVEGVETIDEAFQKMAQKVAKAAAEGLQSLGWQTTVIAATGDRVELAVGKSSGLAVGHRLAVFEGRHVITGEQGQSYIAPGFKLGEIQITSVDVDRSQAVIQNGGGIKAGDIVVPAGK